MKKHDARRFGFSRLLGLAALLTIVAAAAPRALSAHPSVSVVVTPDGRVYFSDLERVWVLDPDGSFRVAVPLWLREWSRSNQPRLRRIDPSGAEQIFGPPGVDDS